MSDEPDDSKSGSLFVAVLPWIATTAGLSALLATTGYIVHFAQEDLLGVSLEAQSSTAAFVLDGARFFADLGVLFLSANPDLFSTILILTLLLLLVLGIRYLLARKNGSSLALKRVPTWVYPLFILLAVIAESAWYELPTMYIQDVLFKPVEVGPTIPLSQTFPRQLEGRIAALRNSIVCSRAVLSGCTGTQSFYRGKLEGWFSFNLVLTILFSTLGLRTLTTKPSDPVGNARPRISIFSPLGLSLFLALLLALFGIPFVYAKTVKPTHFLDADIVFRRSAGAEQVSRASVAETPNPQKSPATNRKEKASRHTPGKPLDSVPPASAISTQDIKVDPPLADDLSGANWYILSDNTDRLLLYNQDTLHIWSIPRNDLQGIEVVGDGDVLKSYFQEWFNLYGDKEGEDNGKKI